MSSELNPLDVSSWDVCDIHESTYLKDGYCKQCRIEELEAGHTKSEEQLREWQDRLTATEAQLELVRPYIDHREKCLVRKYGKAFNCDCGLEQAQENDSE